MFLHVIKCCNMFHTICHRILNLFCIFFKLISLNSVLDNSNENIVCMGWRDQKLFTVKYCLFNFWLTFVTKDFNSFSNGTSNPRPAQNIHVSCSLIHLLPLFSSDHFCTTQFEQWQRFLRLQVRFNDVFLPTVPHISTRSPLHAHAILLRADTPRWAGNRTCI